MVEPTRFRRESPTQKIPLDHFNRITSAGSFKVTILPGVTTYILLKSSHLEIR